MVMKRLLERVARLETVFKAKPVEPAWPSPEVLDTLNAEIEALANGTAPERDDAEWQAILNDPNATETMKMIASLGMDEEPSTTART